MNFTDDSGRFRALKALGQSDTSPENSFVAQFRIVCAHVPEVPVSSSSIGKHEVFPLALLVKEQIVARYLNVKSLHKHVVETIDLVCESSGAEERTYSWTVKYIKYYHVSHPKTMLSAHGHGS